MSFDWKTPMRGLDDYEARAADQLAGQAAAKFLDGGRVQLIALPDRHCLNSTVTISADDALALAHAITERFGSKEPKAGREELIMHLASEHAAGFAIRQDWQELMDTHAHEHRGPGTIRNHDADSLYFDRAKAEAVIAEFLADDPPPRWRPPYHGLAGE